VYLSSNLRLVSKSMNRAVIGLPSLPTRLIKHGQLYVTCQHFNVMHLISYLEGKLLQHTRRFVHSVYSCRHTKRFVHSVYSCRHTRRFVHSVYSCRYTRRFVHSVYSCRYTNVHCVSTQQNIHNHADEPNCECRSIITLAAESCSAGIIWALQLMLNVKTHTNVVVQ
jgi:hypothetical protein